MPAGYDKYIDLETLISASKSPTSKAIIVAPIVTSKVRNNAFGRLEKYLTREIGKFGVPT